MCSWAVTGEGSVNNILSSQDQAIKVLNGLAGFPRSIHHNESLGRVLRVDNFVVYFFFLLLESVTLNTKVFIPEKSLCTFQNINLAFTLTKKT